MCFVFFNYRFACLSHNLTARKVQYYVGARHSLVEIDLCTFQDHVSVEPGKSSPMRILDTETDFLKRYLTTANTFSGKRRPGVIFCQGQGAKAVKSSMKSNEIGKAAASLSHALLSFSANTKSITEACTETRRKALEKTYKPENPLTRQNSWALVHRNDSPILLDLKRGPGITLRNEDFVSRLN